MSESGVPRLEPPPSTVERWCFDLVTTRDLSRKLAPPLPPDPRVAASFETAGMPRCIEAPGRPPELRVVARSPRTPPAGALVRTEARAQLVHTFVHHELQAAELFAWAVLAFPDTPREFKAGLLRLCCEELAHLQLYAAHLGTLGHCIGDFPVRDWFWERVVHCTSPAMFVALQGLGLEGANLEHSARFAALFRAAGDEAGARILERVEQDEIAHVAFAAHWFERFTGAPLEYDAWSASLPKPLTPALLHGRPLNREARLRAGFDARFLERLEAEPSTRIPRRHEPA
jgi:uncharacterized ferritin-like protein (DUF455 family)